MSSEILSIILLIRETKSLDPFLRKLRRRRSVKFDTVIVYIEKEYRMLIFFKNNSYKIDYINKKGITHTTMHLNYTHIYYFVSGRVC